MDEGSTSRYVPDADTVVVVFVKIVGYEEEGPACRRGFANHPLGFTVDHTNELPRLEQVKVAIREAVGLRVVDCRPQHVGYCTPVALFLAEDRYPVRRPHNPHIPPVLVHHRVFENLGPVSEGPPQVPRAPSSILEEER